MTHNKLYKPFLMALAAGVISGGIPLAASPPVEANLQMNHPASAEATGLLKEIRSHAYSLSMTAQKLETFPRNQFSWQTHASELLTTKDLVNAIGDKLERLQEVRHEAAPWQQEALNSLLPTGVNLAERTQAAIEHLNDNKHYLRAPDYVNHLQTIAEQAGELKDSVNLHLDLANTQDRLEDLRQKVDLTRS